MSAPVSLPGAGEAGGGMGDGVVGESRRENVSVMRFRKRPVVIEAMLFTEDNAVAVQEFIGHHGSAMNGPSVVEIRTLEGTMYATPGDWIIKGVAGEFYPCKPDIFEATYEPAAIR